MKLSFLLLLYSLVFSGGCSDSPSMEKLPSDAVILAFGDSLTFGNGAKKGQTYPDILSALSGHRVINAGISGEESAPGLERLPQLLETHTPRLLILCHGGNDILRKKSIGKMEENLREMISLARSENIPVVLLGVPKPGIFLSSAEVYRKIAESTDVLFIENVVADVLGDNALKSDAVHPNSAGYKVMAEAIYSELQKAGAL